jgi:hypothetical protein
MVLSIVILNGVKDLAFHRSAPELPAVVPSTGFFALLRMTTPKACSHPLSPSDIRSMLRHYSESAAVLDLVFVLGFF